MAGAVSYSRGRPPGVAGAERAAHVVEGADPSMLTWTGLQRQQMHSWLLALWCCQPVGRGSLCQHWRARPKRALLSSSANAWQPRLSLAPAWPLEHLPFPGLLPTVTQHRFKPLQKVENHFSPPPQVLLSRFGRPCCSAWCWSTKT